MHWNLVHMWQGTDFWSRSCLLPSMSLSLEFQNCLLCCLCSFDRLCAEQMLNNLWMRAACLETLRRTGFKKRETLDTMFSNSFSRASTCPSPSSLLQNTNNSQQWSKIVKRVIRRISFKSVQVGPFPLSSIWVAIFSKHPCPMNCSIRLTCRFPAKKKNLEILDFHVSCRSSWMRFYLQVPEWLESSWP